LVQDENITIKPIRSLKKEGREIRLLLLRGGDAYHSWIISELQQQSPHAVLPRIRESNTLRVIGAILEDGRHAGPLCRITGNR
jgi:hypothetical protein